VTTQDERTISALVGRVAWLEDVLRETRVAVNRVHQLVEQSQAQLWELTQRVQDAEDRLAVIEPQLAAITRTDAQVLQLKDAVAGVHEHSLGTASRLAELARRVEVAEDRERQALNDYARRIDAVERLTSGGIAHLDNLDESMRRLMEAITVLRQRADETVRAIEVLEARQLRMADADARAEHEAVRIAAELDSLRKQDELIAERVQVYTEMIKRLETQITEVAAEAAVKHEVVEKLEVGRVERQRMEERIARVEAAAENLRDQDQETLRQQTLLDGRQRGFQERLNSLLAEMAAHRAQTNDAFQRLYALQERLKRKQIEDLDRELRELRVHAVRAQEERREEG